MIGHRQQQQTTSPDPVHSRRPLHTISMLVRNKPGVLVRIALVFSRRGYNIESLVVSPDVTNGEFSRMTITCSGDPETLEQIIKQLTKLIDVVHAIDHTGQAVVETEIALVKIQCQLIRAHGDPADRRALQRQGGRLRRRLADRAHRTARARSSTASSACCATIEIVELVRSGKILMARGLATT